MTSAQKLEEIRKQIASEQEAIESHATGDTTPVEQDVAPEAQPPEDPHPQQQEQPQEEPQQQETPQPVSEDKLEKPKRRRRRQKKQVAPPANFDEAVEQLSTLRQAKSVIDGKYNTETAAMRSEISELRAKLDQALAVQQPVSQPKEPDPMSDLGLTQEQLEDLGPETAQLISQIVDAKVSAISNPAIDNLASTVHQQSEMMFNSTVWNQLPDHNEIINSQEFYDWAHTPDWAHGGHTPAQTIAEAQQSFDSTKYIGVFTAFMRQNPDFFEEVEDSDEDGVETIQAVPAQSQVAPNNLVAAPPVESSKPQGRVYTKRDWEEKFKYLLKNRPVDLNAQLAELKAAASEGRVSA